MPKTLAVFALVFFAVLFLTPNAHAQAPICDVTCAPDPGGSTYAGAVAARPKLLNARGFSSPIQVTAGPQQVPMVAGSQSYNYVIPILSLPGRAGMDLNLNLYYNSRVWDVDTVNGTVTFNADRDFPSYGFRLDFGYLEYDVANDQYILTERDGTKHALPNSGGYNSTDGTYINYNSVSKVLTYKNGTTVLYAPFPNTANLFRPTQIKDTNGNYISIAYGGDFDQQISSITDTLGRVINFHYTSHQLTSIDQLIGGSTHTYATFLWIQKYGGSNAWRNFTGLTLIGAPDTSTTPLNVLASCTYANQTSYTFTYGDWAIINRIDNLSASPVMHRSYVSYNYPSAATALSDAPTYTQQTVSPDGLDTNTSVWTYSATKAGTGIVTAISVTDPSPISSITVTNLDPSSGLLSSVQLEDSSAHVLRTIGYSWVQSGAANVPGTITTTLNDTGQQSSVQYSAYDAYGNAGDVKEFDFGGQVLLRHTVTTYTPLVSQHILDLPTRVLVEDASGNIISRTDLSYDDLGSVTINITDAASHDNSVTGHGNLTSISRYSDPVTPGVPVTRHFYYDSTGNVRTAELDCCNQKVFNFSIAKQYAYPESVVRGAGVTQFTTSADWDFDTGLLKHSTDENGQVTGYQYDSMNRLTVVTLPPQGSTSVLINTQYDDNAASPTVTRFASPSTVTVPKTISTMDGLGHVLRVDTYNGSTVVSSSTVSYDKLWRRSQASNPFGPNETPVNTAFSYDPLGRSKLVTPPSGGFTQYDYSGNTVTVTDPAGKQRKNVTDALGRLVEVDEPGVVADHTPANNRATMQTDGNFVLSDILNNALWSTNTAGLNGSSIEIQDDGNFVLYSFRWQAGVYAAPAQGPFTPQTCSIGHVLNAPQNLLGGQCITSPAGQYMLYMGTDGNFFIYDIAHNTGTWGPGTQGHPGAYASMQTDGNLVVYDVNGVALWSSGTSGTFSERLEMANDGRILIFKSVWNSGTMQAPTTQNLTHPSCDVGTGTGTTGILNTGQCFVSFNGVYQVLLQNDGNFVLSNLSITPAQTLWSTNTALTPLSKIVELSTTYSYDPVNNLTSASVASAVINGQLVAGQARNYVYDGLGRLTSATTPESGMVTNDYTGSCAGDPSLVCHTTDARGIIKTFTYDTINRLKTVSYSDGTPGVTYAYDAGGSQAFALDRLTSITEGGNSHTFVYDNFGRIKSDSQLIDTKTYLISYAYNLASQITSITYPSTHVYVQNYDAIGRVCAIGASGSTCTTGTRYLNSPTYNAAGETLSVTFGNSVVGNFTYNDHLQLSTLRYFKGSTEILNLGYDYTSGVSGNNGQIQKMHYYTTPGVEDQTKSEQFTYDGLGRLSAAQTLTVNSTSGAKTWSLQWTYDRFGNRLTQSMLAGDPSFPVGQPTLMINSATNQITNSGYTYDYAGNMTHDATAAYGYDGANRLININATAAVYSYFGPQRIKKVLGSTTTRYIYSGSKPIAEYVNGANANSPSTEYIYAGSKLLVTIAGSATTYHHPDHLSNRAETNSSGTRTRTFGQLPFGESWYETGTADKWKFTSYEHDSGTGETGLDYANFRYYSASQGRFLSADLLAGHLRAPQSLNRYAYARDPVNNIDPLGLFGEPVCYLTVNYEYLKVVACLPDPSFDRGDIDYSNGGGGGGDGSNPGTKPNVNLKALADCLASIFGVLMTNFTPSQEKSAGAKEDVDGSFSGIGVDVMNPGPFVGLPFLSEIPVGNSVGIYSIGEVTKMAKDQGVLPPGPVGTAHAFTDKAAPYVNYTGSGNTDPNDIIENQIFELGNSLSAITGKNPNPTDETDANKLLDCYTKGGPNKK